MAKQKRKTPFDPAAQARQALERLDRESEIKRLEGQGVVVNLDAGRRIISAYRSNVFNLLLERRAISTNQHNAVYRLSQDWAKWKGLDGKPDCGNAGFVDGGGGCREIVTDRMIAGGKEVRAILDQIPPIERRLLEAFMVSTVEDDCVTVWRVTVEKVTGETGKNLQTKAVVAAVELLRQAYEGPAHDVVVRRTAAAY